MGSLREKPPVWFWVAAGVLTLWGALGIYAFYADVTMSEAARAALPDYDRKLLASRPAWFIWLYGAAVWGGLFGAIALLVRSSYARVLSFVALVLVVAMFGYIFAATDLIAVKGFGPAAGFPIFIFVMGALQLWVASQGIKRAWLT